MTFPLERASLAWHRDRSTHGCVVGGGFYRSDICWSRCRDRAKGITMATRFGTVRRADGPADAVDTTTVAPVRLLPSEADERGLFGHLVGSGGRGVIGAG
ncbi:hypothetical protein, partial [Miniimonas arenae]|uniref:hypothetical protein n=1 Tax=Miniimonas arenae TaxID=676201 RepID=UPI0028B20DEE